VLVVVEDAIAADVVLVVEDVVPVVGVAVLLNGVI
jgi:hypothetical protein